MLIRGTKIGRINETDLIERSVTLKNTHNINKRSILFVKRKIPLKKLFQKQPTDLNKRKNKRGIENYQNRRRSI